MPEHVLADDRPGSGWSRSARSGAAASRATCARCRIRAAKPKPPWVCMQASAACQAASDAEQLGHVGFRAAGLAGLEQRGGLAQHQVGGLGLGIGARDRELDALVLADRPAEHDALVGVGRRPSRRTSARRRCASAATRMRSAFMPSRM